MSVMNIKEKKSALILGASGLIGGHLLEFLLKDDSYREIIVPVRKSLQIKHEKLVECIIDFDRMENLEEYLPVSIVFCCLGTTIKKAGNPDNFYKVDYTYCAEGARIASNSGCEKFLIVTALGADLKSSMYYNRVKGEIEEKIKEYSFKEIHIFRPSLLRGERTESRTGEDLLNTASSLFSFMFVGPLQQYKPIGADVVAFAMKIQADSRNEGTHIYESSKIQEIYSLSQNS